MLAIYSLKTVPINYIVWQTVLISNLAGKEGEKVSGKVEKKEKVTTHKQDSKHWKKHPLI